MASKRESQGRMKTASGSGPISSHRSTVVTQRERNRGGPRKDSRGRTQTVARKADRKTVGSGPSAAAHAHAGARRSTVPPRMKGLGLRAKLMIASAGLTCGAVIILGAALAYVANSYLFGQLQHKGVEMAKLAAQVVRASMDIREATRDPTAAKMQLSQYLKNATTWGDEPQRYSDIIAVDVLGVSDLTGTVFGEPSDARNSGIAYKSITVPRTGTVNLDGIKDISVAQMTRPVKGVNQQVLRYKIRLNTKLGLGDKEIDYLGEGSEIRMDLAASKVFAVRNQLYVIIGAVLLASAGVMIFISHRVAVSITKPVRVLVHDMHVVARGDLEHVTRVRSKDEVGLLAQAFNKMTQDLLVAQDALVEQEKAEYELSIAQEVQQQLLPAELPTINGYEPFAFYRGAKAVSGDYYDFIPLGEGKWGFIVADVSGKGIPGSMVMAVTRTIFRLTANKYPNSAASTLKETNRLIAKQIKRGMFVTAFYAILDENSGNLVFASAGHNPMLIYRAAGRNCELAAPKGIAIGFNEGPIFDKNIQEFQTTLNPNDMIVIYTDGFPEAMNEANEEFGDDKFYQTVAAGGHLGSKGMVQHLLAQIEDHRGRAPQSDDLTLIAVRRRA